MRKRTAILALSFLCAAAVALFGWALTEHARAIQGERAALAAGSRAFGELCASLTELDTALQKSLYATSPATAGALCTQVYGRAMTAQQALGALPLSGETLEKTAGFVSRVGDYAFMLSRSAARGAAYTGQERENLAALAEISEVLCGNLRQLRLDLLAGRLDMGELLAAPAAADGAEGAALPATLSGGLRLTEQEFPEVPSLIYDGPFSAHLDRAEPLALKGLPELTEQEALTEARALLGSRAAVKSLGKTEGKLPTWNFSVREGSAETTLALSVRGARPVGLLCSRPVGEAKLTTEEALEKARQYAARYGFAGAESSYHMTQGGVLTVNFAYVQSGVVCWADLVKIGVALDDGGLVSLEARGWLMNHRARDIPAPRVGEAEAAKAAGEGLTIESSRLSLVPRPGGEEVFCREFTCRGAAGRRFVVCVNALTGEQEKILILLEDETGSLTI